MERSPSIASGAMAFSLLAMIVVTGWTVTRTLWRPVPGAPPSCCAVPIEIVEGQWTRVGCRGEAALASCGALDPGDRVILDGACRVEYGGMSAGLRLLQGLALDLNRASAADLELLDGIGPALGRAIVSHREARGRFRSVDELLEVRGIGAKTLGAIRPQLTVESGPVGDPP